MEAEVEAFGKYKEMYATEKSGVDPNSINYALNPFARANYRYYQALTVTSRAEGVQLVLTTAVDVGLQYVGNLKITNQSIRILKYPNAKGYGINTYVNGERTIGLDWHQFKIGGKKNGVLINRPHIDLPQNNIKHFPWHQINKYKRGVK